jgi:FAD/FMN-containing dehydrogenase
VARLAEFLGFLERQTGIRPVWVCPLRQRDPEVTWSLYPLEPGILWVNVGFWSTVALPPGESEGFHNRAVEREVSRLGGRKSLYSTSFYEPAEFWRYYGGGGTYEILKKSYDPDARLLDLYAKTVGRR